EIGRLLDGEIREPGPDASLVDYPVAPVSARQRNVRLERRLDDTGVGVAPDEAGENAHVPTLDEAEASRPARDLRQLPREQRSPLLPVELRRLREEERLAGEIDPVAEDVGRDAHVGGPREKAFRSEEHTSELQS